MLIKYLVLEGKGMGNVGLNTSSSVLVLLQNDDDDGDDGACPGTSLPQLDLNEVLQERMPVGDAAWHPRRSLESLIRPILLKTTF